MNLLSSEDHTTARVKHSYLVGAEQPLSKITLHCSGVSRRQMELNMPMRVPEGSCTGPLLRARVPDGNTSTVSGSQENGASAESKYLDQYARTDSLPRSGVDVVKKMASSDSHLAKAFMSRSAIDLAKDRSAFMTSCRVSSIDRFFGYFSL